VWKVVGRTYMIKRVERMEGRGIVSGIDRTMELCSCCWQVHMLGMGGCPLCYAQARLIWYLSSLKYGGVKWSWLIYEWFCCCSGALLMPLCCQTASTVPSLLNILSLPSIFCRAGEIFGWSFVCSSTMQFISWMEMPQIHMRFCILCCLETQAIL